jgi:mercuric ion transport protein
LARDTEGGVAALGTLASAGALFSAAACCVLPLAFAAAGLGAGGLAAVVPYHWPLTIGAALAVGAGWLFYWRKRRTCAADASCVAAPSRSTLWMLVLATAFVGLSVVWKAALEQPLMRLLGGA